MKGSRGVSGAGEAAAGPTAVLTGATAGGNGGQRQRGLERALLGGGAGLQQNLRVPWIWANWGQGKQLVDGETLRITGLRDRDIWQSELCASILGHPREMRSRLIRGSARTDCGGNLNAEPTDDPEGPPHSRHQKTQCSREKMASGGEPHTLLHLLKVVSLVFLTRI